MRQAFHVVIIGGGPAGVAAGLAIGAKHRTALIDEHGTAGPAVLDEVMTEAFIAAAGSGGDFQAAQSAALAARDDYLEQLPEKRALQATGVAVITGRAEFTKPLELSVGHDSLTAKVAIIATGSSAGLPSLAGPVPPQPLQALFTQTRPPQRLVVLGWEPGWRPLLAALVKVGTRVQIISDQPLAGQGSWTAYRGNASSIERLQRSYRVNYHSESQTASLGGELVVAVANPKPNLDLGLAAAGISISASGISVDERYETTIRHCYAIGDCIGHHELAAAQQGRLVGDRVAQSGL